MNLPSKAELENLERNSQEKLLKKNMEIQKARHKELKHLNTIPLFTRNMRRLQARSYPLGCDIIIDSTHTGEITPHTFEDLEEGKHIVEMHYVEPGTGEIIAKKEEVDTKQGKRVIVKIHFLHPKTLADVSELSR